MRPRAGCRSCGRSWADRWVPVAADGSTLGSAGKIAGIDRPAVHASEVILFTPGYGPAIAPLPAHLPAGASGRTPTTEDSTTIVPDVARAAGAQPDRHRDGRRQHGARAVRIPAGRPRADRYRAAAGAIAARLAGRDAQSPWIARIAGIAPGTLALGGGPALVVAGHAVHNAGEGFVADQLVPRSERTAIGQAADGTELLVSAEGPGQGSPGITVPQQADLMVRLGARTAIAMDSGGSSQMIVNGADVMPWAQPRAISTAAVVRYAGVRVSPLPVAAVAQRRRCGRPCERPGDRPEPRHAVGDAVGRPPPAITLLDRAVPAIPVALSIDPVRLGIPGRDLSPHGIADDAHGRRLARFAGRRGRSYAREPPARAWSASRPAARSRSPSTWLARPR